MTTFTSGQGLVLMKEVLYTISGKRLPVVMNIGARALTSQGLNVHAGHDGARRVFTERYGLLDVAAASVLAASASPDCVNIR